MKTAITIVLLFLMPCLLLAQSEFDAKKYQEFVEKHNDMSSGQLLEMYPAGDFLSKYQTDISNALFFDEADELYKFTDYEMSLIEKHGFMVTERVEYNNFQQAFYEIFNNDLPVYLSADAILYAYHKSFQKILMELEENEFAPGIEESLEEMKNKLNSYPLSDDNQEYNEAIYAVDLYIAVAQSLIKDEEVLPEYSRSKDKYDEILISIENGGIGELILSEYTYTSDYDFSQFKVRGHYTQSEVLGRYFKTMMWLGRVLINISEPNEDEFNGEKRYISNSYVSLILAEISRKSKIGDLDIFLNKMLGEQDNLTPNECKLDPGLSIDNLSHSQLIKIIEEIKSDDAAKQSYMSEIIMSDINDPEPVVLNEVFALCGQRFIFDAFILANVVFDRINYKGDKVLRMLPQTPDALFALGNDAAIQLLQGELDKYHYSDNLAGLRYLSDSFNDEFWDQTVYTSWLNSIRQLNPPLDRTGLPGFMQTAAWQQKNINTQLAGWAEMRHDVILYAKPSYTAGYVCDYPHTFVEPVPDFYRWIEKSAENLKKSTEHLSGYWKYGFDSYTDKVIEIMQKLATISEKQLNNENFSSEEKGFLKSMIRENYVNCDSRTYVHGWWYSLLYGQDRLASEALTVPADILVVDYHTAPTDEYERLVGWVLHAGTGALDLAVIVTENNDGDATTFVGPVLSYYEYLTEDFERLNDEEWASIYFTELRPDYVNLYMADNKGESRGAGNNLFTDVEEETKVEHKNFVKAYPNPFEEVVRFAFTNPSHSDLTIEVYNQEGNLINKIFKSGMERGNYVIDWHGVDMEGNPVPIGLYVYKLKLGEFTTTGKVIKK
jgi:hypothetical protein